MTAPLLVIAHEATRTGSLRALLPVLGHLGTHLERPILVETLAGGPLADELLALSTADDDEAPCATLLNSVPALDAVDRLPIDLPVALYVHEDDEGLEMLRTRREQLARCDRIWCVSRHAREQLADLVDEHRIVVIPPVVSEPPPVTTAEIDAVRSELDAVGRPLVVACGEAVWHKGPDLFVDLASRLAARRDVVMAWVGRRSLPAARQLDLDVAAAGLSDRVWFTGEVASAHVHLAAADVVVMTSRRDAQPLVPYEAALSGTPTVAFAAGGSSEMAARHAARTVPFPDTAAMAREVERLITDPAQGAQLAATAAVIARTERSIEALGPTVVDAVESLVSARTEVGAG